MKSDSYDVYSQSNYLILILKASLCLLFLQENETYIIKETVAAAKRLVHMTEIVKFSQKSRLFFHTHFLFCS